MKTTRILLFLVLFTVKLFAQTTQQPFHPAKSLEHYTIDHWTGDSGLNSNNTTGVCQDDLGYLWISSYNGLLRFDGHSFTIFDKENLNFLSTDAISIPYPDRRGGILFTTQGSGVIRYHEGNLSPLIPDEIIPVKSIRSLWQENDSTFWIGSNNKGLYIYENDSVIQINHPLLNEISIFAIQADENNVVWVVTNGNGLFKLKNRQVERIYTTQDGLLSNRLTAILKTKSGQLYVGGSSGVSLMNGERFYCPNENWKYHTNQILEDNFGSIWIATERGLIRHHPDYELNEWVGKKSIMKGQEISYLCFDKEGSLWMASSKSGLIRMKETGLYTLNIKDGLSNRLNNTVVSDKTGTIFIGNDVGEIDRLKNGIFEAFNLDHKLDNLRIRDIAFDQHDAIWIATYQGLVKKTKHSEKIFNISTANFPAQDVRRVLINEQQEIWVATRTGGAFRMVNEKIEAEFNMSKGLLSDYILALEQDRHGNTYLGTHGGGLSKIDAQDRIYNFNIRPDDSGLLIFNIHIDEDDRIWVVTNIGLFFFDGTHFIPLNLSTTIKGESIFDWIEDDIGHVWVTTNKGILQFEKQDVINFIDGKTPNIPTNLFNTEDGMDTNECTGATRSHLSADGRVWVPTINGVVVINPAELHQNTLKPEVDINRLITDDSTYLINPNYEQTEVKIPAGNLRYIFHFTSLSLFAPSKNKFEYKLVGFDKNWIPTDNNRVVEYTNLAPGNYSFQMKASNNDGLWNNEGIAFQFEVLPYYYQTKTFLVLLVLFTILFILWIIKWRTNEVNKQNRQLSKLNAELDRFVYSASHDLRAPLTSILGLVSLMKNEEQKNENYLNLVEQSVKRLDNFISDIINFSRNARLEIIPELIDFQSTIDTVFEHISYLDQDDKITKKISVKGNGEFLTDKTRLDIVLNNLISNAIKYQNLYQNDPYINVDVRISNEEATITIEDNGQGIKTEHHANIFNMFYRANDNNNGSGLGLYIVKETVEKLGGSIRFSSTYGKGSTFTIQLPNLKN